MNLNTGDTRLLIEVGRRRGLLRNQLAYVLATVRYETGGKMKPVRENMNYRAERILEVFGAKHSAKVTKAEAQKLAGNPQALAERVYGLGNPTKAAELGNTQKGDGYKYRGGGYEQRTGRKNFRRVGLESNPDKIVDPAEAALAVIKDMVEGNYTGVKLSDYITLQKSDFTNARRVINSLDSAALIAGYARDYDDALRAEGYGKGSIKPDPVDPVPQPETPIEPTPPQAGGLAALVVKLFAAIATIFKGKSREQI